MLTQPSLTANAKEPRQNPTAPCLSELAKPFTGSEVQDMLPISQDGVLARSHVKTASAKEGYASKAFKGIELTSLFGMVTWHRAIIPQKHKGLCILQHVYSLFSAA